MKGVLKLKLLLIVILTMLIVLILTSFLWFQNYLKHRSGFVYANPFKKDKIIYIDTNGTTIKGLQKINGIYYYFSNEDGARQSGWHTIDNKTYYFDHNGASVRGLQTINQHTYYFNQDGVLYKDQYIRYIKDGKDTLSYFNEQGELVNKPREVNFIPQSFTEDGNLQVDRVRLQQGVEQLIQKHGGNIQVYFKDLRTNSKFLINNHVVYPCCMIKVPALVEIFSRIERNEFTYEQYKPYIDAMIITSDNSCYNKMMHVLGYGNPVLGVQSVTKRCQDLKLTSTQLHHGLRPGNLYFSDGYSNQSCCEDLGVLFEKLYRNELLSSKSHEIMISILKQCDDEDYIPAGLPKDTPYAQKTGCAYDLYHDGGIIYLPHRDYILVIFSQGCPNIPAMMSDISQYIYNQQTLGIQTDQILDLR